MQAQTESELLECFVASHKLPQAYLATAHRWFLPLAEELAQAITNGGLRVLGVVGTQGSGKSTLAALLEELLSQVHGLRAASLSLDDFYLTHAERQQLAREVHPLLATRGVPGTHDIPLALDTIKALLSHSGDTAVVRFDKAKDDRRPETHWDKVRAPVDVVILEGWCLGVQAQPATEVAEPLNALERLEDRSGRWRGYVNECLQEDYPQLFQLIQKLILLKAPSFDCVYQWRRQQERKLSPTAGDKIMSDDTLNRFVQHFERITRHSLTTLPQTADTVLELDREQCITGRHDN